MTVTIRDGREEDIEAVVALTRDYFRVSRFNGRTDFNADKVNMTFLTAIEMGNLFRVAEKNGKVVGFSHAILSTLPWSDAPGLSDTTVYADPDAARAVGLSLLRDLKRQAEEMRARFILFSWISGWRDDKLMRILSRLGFEQIGHIAYLSF